MLAIPRRMNPMPPTSKPASSPCNHRPFVLTTTWRQITFPLLIQQSYPPPKPGAKRREGKRPKQPPRIPCNIAPITPDK